MSEPERGGAGGANEEQALVPPNEAEIATVRDDASDANDEKAARKSALLLAALMFAFCAYCVYRMIVVWPDPHSQERSTSPTSAPPPPASTPPRAR